MVVYMNASGMLTRGDEQVSSDFLERSGRVKYVRESHFHETSSVGPALAATAGSTPRVRKYREIVPKLPPARTRASNDYAHKQTTRETQKFAVQGWGSNAKVVWDAFPEAAFEPDTSVLFTSRVVQAQPQPPHRQCSSAKKPSAHTPAFPEEEVEWDAITEDSPTRVKKETAAAEARIARMTCGHGDPRACSPRGRVELQHSLSVPPSPPPPLFLSLSQSHTRRHTKSVTHTHTFLALQRRDPQSCIPQPDTRNR